MVHLVNQVLMWRTILCNMLWNVLGDKSSDGQGFIVRQLSLSRLAWLLEYLVVRNHNISSSFYFIFKTIYGTTLSCFYRCFHLLLLPCFFRKMQSKILINCKENYNGYNPITKEGRIFESPLYLKLGSSCGDGEWILFSIDRPNDNLLLNRLEDAK